jgi:hypothetical protein
LDVGNLPPGDGWERRSQKAGALIRIERSVERNRAPEAVGGDHPRDFEMIDGHSRPLERQILAVKQCAKMRSGDHAAWLGLKPAGEPAAAAAIEIARPACHALLPDRRTRAPTL